jgi:hypothetical protein
MAAVVRGAVASGVVVERLGVVNGHPKSCGVVEADTGCIGVGVAATVADELTRSASAVC